jgi:hypothetical protein
MINLCDEGELSQIKRKITDVISLFARKVEGYKSLYSEESDKNSPRLES